MLDPNLVALVDTALMEDIGTGDLTTATVILRRQCSERESS